MKIINKFICLALIVIAGYGCEQGGNLISNNENTYRIKAMATAGQITPSDAEASIEGWYYKETNVLSLTLKWSDLWIGADNLTDISFYSGQNGSNGLFVRKIDINSSNASGGINISLAGYQGLTGQQISDLIAGNWYFVLKTSENPDGVVRGQITATLKDPDTNDPNYVTDIILNGGVELITIIENKEQTIDISILPHYADNSEVKWESSDTNILTVDQNGVVKGIRIGKAAITVSALDAGGVRKTLNVDVINPDKVSSIDLDAANRYNLLAGGATLQLNTTVLPETALNKTLNYVSSNTQVATVNENGVVTGISAGETTIAITSKDGTDIQVTCTVLVDAVLSEYDRSSWDVACSSEKSSDGGGKMMILGNDPARYWHSMWSPDSPLPHWLVIDMKEIKPVNKIYVSRRSGNTDTRVVIVSASADGINYTPLRTIDFGAGADVFREIVFPTVAAQYIRLDITDSNRKPFANLSIMRVYKIE